MYIQDKIIYLLHPRTFQAQVIFVTDLSFPLAFFAALFALTPLPSHALGLLLDPP